MAENVYKVIELVGTSPDPGEGRGRCGQRAAKTLRDLRWRRSRNSICS